ncbi:Gp138 family membrane-puncturing spike protein [Anaerobutyricum hallii]|uniref:Gp138 family membrane-puncturing spike protein n=1 Tax=Anaerobutyricum hallii TaxID=39488 RepID=UPI000E72E7FF|nr:Gp138 family membrane-puncturing spike protein [Anaerobutyricum hallii]RJW41943.1 hypothetical protein DXC97_02445 [Lachnospiraceae bacterium TF09-5]
MNRSEGYAYEEAKRNTLFQQLHVAALVEVIATYPEEMNVDVKPLVKSLREGSYISQPPILRVPVMQLGSSAFPIRPQYEVGDCGLIVYLDQDSDNVLLSGQETEPQTENYHSAAYPVFCGFIQTGISTEPKEYLEVSKKGVTVHGRINIEGDLIVNGAHIGGA